jgi:hypothetical protein
MLGYFIFIFVPLAAGWCIGPGKAVMKVRMSAYNLRIWKMKGQKYNLRNDTGLSNVTTGSVEQYTSREHLSTEWCGTKETKGLLVPLGPCLYVPELLAMWFQTWVDFHSPSQVKCHLPFTQQKGFWLGITRWDHPGPQPLEDAVAAC